MKPVPSKGVYQSAKRPRRTAAAREARASREAVIGRSEAFFHWAPGGCRGFFERA
jgi:hypothetical protein